MRLRNNAQTAASAWKSNISLSFVSGGGLPVLTAVMRCRDVREFVCVCV